MRNNKGFTLMELLVAVFIASMVTVALVTIWKAASIQTSQGQRQTMIRNNLSILMRSLHRDITEADLVLAPYGAGQSGALIVMARNAHLDSFGSARWVVRPEVSSLGGTPDDGKYESDPTVIAYCLNGSTVRRTQTPLTESKKDDELVTELSTACNSGKVYMDYTTSFNVSTSDNINYKVEIIIHKDFAADAATANSQTPPIHIEMENTFTKAGGK